MVKNYYRKCEVPGIEEWLEEEEALNQELEHPTGLPFPFSFAWKALIGSSSSSDEESN